MRKWVWGVGAALVGVGLLVWSFVLAASQQRDDWWSNTLLSAGVAMLLIAPIAVISMKITAQITQVRDDVHDDVEALTERVDRTLEDVAESVAAQLQGEREDDEAVFDGLRASPSRSIVADALDRARARGVVDFQVHSPRVQVIEDGPLFIAFRYQRVGFEKSGEPPRAGEIMTLEVEHGDGRLVERIVWEESATTEEVLVRVGRIVQQETDKRVSQSDVARIFNDLADLLHVGNSHRLRRPVIQLCPPQWVVTARGISRYGDRRIPIEFRVDRLRDEHQLARWVSEKSWGDVESFGQARDHAVDLLSADDQ